MTTVICPYCFARASAAKLPYRCLMTPSGVRGGAPCGPESDDAWAGFMGPGVPPAARMRGPLFTPARKVAGLGGGGSSVPCPQCGVPTPVRVCGSCHSDLPSDYCDQDSRIIALVGAKASGKSTYVSVLVNELNHRVGQAYHASLAAMGQSTQTRDREMAEDLYERLRLPDATRPAALGFNDPLLYRLSLPRRSLLGGTGTRHTTLVFFDAAGEDLAGTEAMDRYTRYLGAADGIILLVDPLQLGSVRDRLPVHEGPPLPVVETPPQQIAADLAAQLRAHGKGSSRGRVSTPIAVAVTKADMLRPLLDPHSPLLRNAPHSAGTYDGEDRLAVHEELRSLLTDWDSGALLRQLELDFGELSLFGLSALGAPPPADAPADVPKSGPQPVRVEDPLLWLLSRRGLLPVRAAGKGRAR
ncbi:MULTISPECIES: TRAFAC clade GTPase domain-containing protein [unclassified Streptomyces]|uniref:TRAFAC clade GTPase domain-containing protein n=1 Tax=unclassified Streptomyces TaxID=2593676 RepID=UPI003009460F